MAFEIAALKPATVSNAIGLDAADGVDARNDMADLIGAWQAAGDQSKRESALRAEYAQLVADKHTPTGTPTRAAT